MNVRVSNSMHRVWQQKNVLSLISFVIVWRSRIWIVRLSRIITLSSLLWRCWLVVRRASSCFSCFQKSLRLLDNSGQCGKWELKWLSSSLLLFELHCLVMLLWRCCRGTLHDNDKWAFRRLLLLLLLFLLLKLYWLEWCHCKILQGHFTWSCS